MLQFWNYRKKIMPETILISEVNFPFYFINWWFFPFTAERKGDKEGAAEYLKKTMKLAILLDDEDTQLLIKNTIDSLEQERDTEEEGAEEEATDEDGGKESTSESKSKRDTDEMTASGTLNKESSAESAEEETQNDGTEKESDEDEGEKTEGNEESSETDQTDTKEDEN